MFGAPDSIDVAIVGGGFSGTMTAYHLLRKNPGVRVTLFEQHATQLAGGNAYTPSSKYHLLNVPAGAMGACPDDSGAFLRWLNENGRNVASTAFVPREWFGAYMRQLCARMTGIAKNNFRLVHESITSAKSEGELGITLQNASGNIWHAAHVVVATGTIPRAFPVVTDRTSDTSRVVMFPWHHSVFDDATPEESIAIIGSGLSTIDLLVEGLARGHRGEFVVISPPGTFPCVHSRDLSPISPLAEAPAWETAREALHGVRQLALSFPEWQHAIDALRPFSNRIWQRFSFREKQRFLRHLSWHWERHRHRMPAQAQHTIDTLRSEHRLKIYRVAVNSITANKDSATLHCRTRAGAHVDIPCQRVVNCAGFMLDISRGNSPFLQSLVREKLCYPGDFGLGIRSDARGALCTPEGDVIPGMWCIGSMRRGTLLECTAVRELREQALTLGEDIARMLNERKVPEALELQSAAD